MEENTKNKATIKDWIKDILIAVIIAVLIMQFIRPTVVKQSSMEPTLYEGHYLLLSKQSYGLFGNEPEYGEIVVFKSTLEDERGNDKLLIKRVIGKPGDSIEIKNGNVYRNGQRLEEDYVMSPGTTYPPFEIDKKYIMQDNEYFLMGDNREVSVDSRYDEVGCVSKDKIVGKVVLRLYPFNEIGSVE